MESPAVELDWEAESSGKAMPPYQGVVLVTFIQKVELEAIGLTNTYQLNTYNDRWAVGGFG